MSSFTKKDQDKSIFTVKRDGQGNIVVSRASGRNGGEIRGSIFRTNEGKPYLVPGYGMKILSGSNSGYPSSGQVTVELDLESIKKDIEGLVIATGISGMVGPPGPPGATGATGPAGAKGADGADGNIGPQGAGITSVVDNLDGTVTFGYDDSSTAVVVVPASTMVVNSTVTGDPGTDASVTNIGTPNNAEFDFVIPRGANGLSAYEVAYEEDDTIGDEATWLASLKGDQGDQGDQGEPGDVGNPGPQGDGWTGITDNGDGTITFESDDGLEFTTGDLTGPAGPAGSGFATDDKFTFYIPITSSTNEFVFSDMSSGATDDGGGSFSGGPEVHEFEIAQTMLDTASFNIPAMTQELYWEIMFSAKVDSNIAGEEWEYRFKLQRWETVGTPMWVDVDADLHPAAGYSVASDGVFDFIATDLQINNLGATGLIRLKLVCEAQATSTVSVTMQEDLELTIFASRIKVQYTVP